MTKLATMTCLILAAAAPSFGQRLVHRADQPIPGRYVVVFQGADLPVPAGLPGTRGMRVRELALDVARDNGAAVGRVFSHALHGAVMTMSREQAAALALDPRVASVEEDGVVRLAGTQVEPPSWGLDRIDQAALPLDLSYSWADDAAGVDVYVVDSGILSSHVDFGGRVDTAGAFTAVADGNGTEDCNGHGTAVASLIGGASFGVAKGVTLHPVRVVGCDGTGAISDLVAGLDWITARRQAEGTEVTVGKGKNRTTTIVYPHPAVTNVSLVSGGSAAIDAAVNQLMDADVAVVAAAGNDGGDSCGYSPGRVARVLTAGASNDADNVWTSSNGGYCTDLFAPGVAVAVAWNGSDTDSTLFTGTSAAAPHVAGAAAIYLAANPDATALTVENDVKLAATTDVLALVPLNTPNRLLFIDPGTASSGGTGTEDAPPTAVFVASCRNQRCTFDAGGSSDDVGIASYAWDLGDGSTASGSKVRYAYGTAGGYAVTLTVTDSSGQSATMTRQIRP